MPDPGEHEIALYKKLTAHEIADDVEGIIKKRFAILAVIAAVLSAFGAGGIIYQIMASSITTATTGIQQAIALNGVLKDNITSAMSAVAKAKEEQEKLKADAEDARALVADAKLQFDASRAQFMEAQNKSAKSLEELIGLLRVQSDALKDLLSNPKVSQILGGEDATRTQVSALQSALTRGEATVRQVQEAAQNSHYIVFIHLPRNRVVDASVENGIREWLSSQGYVVGGVTRDDTGQPRLGYFYQDDEAAAKKIAEYIRTTYPTYFSDLQANLLKTVRNPVGYIGLWL